MTTGLRLWFGRRRSPLGYLPWAHAYFRRRHLRSTIIAVPVAADTILCRVLGRFKLFAAAGDTDITPHLALDGLWEPAVTAVIADRLRRGDTAIDVGANVGYFTLLMAGLVGANGRVLAFEPHPVTAGLLQRTLRVNGVGRQVDCHVLPLGGEDGLAAAMILPENLLGSAHLAAVDYPGAVPVAATRRLDGIAGAADAVLVKLDVEGSEERVWQGMTALIAGSRLRYVVIEFSREGYADARGFLESAVAHGFTVRLIERTGRLPSVQIDEVLAGPAQQMLLFER